MKVVKLSDDASTQKYQLREIEFFSFVAEQGLLDHKNIIRYLAFVNDDQTRSHCVFMELCHETLGQAMKGPHAEMDWRKYVQYLTFGICQGVNYLHEIGIIHRDIAPSNILLKYENGREEFPTVKVADFNVYTIHDTERRDHTQYHTAAIGTPNYRAKEVTQLMKGRPGAVYGCPADVWSIGAVVYEIDTRHVFMHLTEQEIWAEQLFNTEEKIRINVRDRQLREFLYICLQWNPGHRYRCNQLLKNQYLISAAESERHQGGDCRVNKVSR